MKYILATYLMFSVLVSSIVLLFYQNSNHILFAASEKQMISFSFKNDVDISAAEKIVSEMKKKYDLPEADLHSPADQYNEFAKSFSMYNQGVFEAEEIISLIPFAVDFTAPAESNPNELKKLLLSENIFVSSDSSSSWALKFQSVIKFIENTGRFAFLVLFFSSALITASVVRILIFQDAPKIKIRSFLGESFSITRWHYFIKTSVFSILGLTSGLGFSYLVFQYILIQIKLKPEFSFVADRLQFLDLSSIAFLFFGFLTAVIAGSSWALKQLQAEIDDQA